jgi:hypothetical protein
VNAEDKQRFCNRVVALQKICEGKAAVLSEEGMGAVKCEEM